MGGLEKRLNRPQAIVAQLQDEEAAGFKVPRGFGDEQAVEFVTLVAAAESRLRLVLANFDRQQLSFAAPDVGRIADEEVEKRRRSFVELRRNAHCPRVGSKSFEEIGFDEMDAVGKTVPGGRGTKAGFTRTVGLAV